MPFYRTKATAAVASYTTGFKNTHYTPSWQTRNLHAKFARDYNKFHARKKYNPSHTFKYWVHEHTVSFRLNQCSKAVTCHTVSGVRQIFMSNCILTRYS